MFSVGIVQENTFVQKSSLQSSIKICRWLLWKRWWFLGLGFMENDEIKFGLLVSTRHGECGEAMNTKNTIPNVKHGGSNFRLCFCANWTFSLFKIVGTMKKECDILKENLKDSASTFLEDDILFFNRIISEKFAQNQYLTLAYKDSRTDLNPIENLWWQFGIHLTQPLNWI